MEDAIKISVITVCYNSVSTIERTIESVLLQGNHVYEYLIIDGGSTDGTMDIVKSYEDKFEGRLRWVSEPDNGIYNAMNKGIKMATGNVIAIINSDDYMERDALSNVSLAFLSTGVEVVCGNVVYIKKDRKSNTYEELASAQIYTRTDKSIRKRIKHYLHPATIIKKSVYEKCGLFNESLGISADYDFMIRMILQDISMAYIDQTICYFTLDGASQKQRVKGIEESRVINKKYLGSWYSLVRYLNENIIFLMKRAMGRI